MRKINPTHTITLDKSTIAHPIPEIGGLIAAGDDIHEIVSLGERHWMTAAAGYRIHAADTVQTIIRADIEPADLAGLHPDGSPLIAGTVLTVEERGESPALTFERWPQMSACNGADILRDGNLIGWMAENESGLWVVGIKGQPSETRASYDSACAAARKTIGIVSDPPPITMSPLDGDTDGWSQYIGRILLQWRDDVEQGPYLLVSGTDDHEAASAAEIADWQPYEVESTDWSQRLHVFRVRTAAEIMAEGYDADDVEAAMSGEDDEIALAELDVIGITIQPEEPDCQKSPHHRIHPQHKWIQGQAYAHGGGVQYTSTCKRCGIQRHTDTWAQDPSTGSQGLRSTAYSEADGETLLRPGIVEQ